MTDQGINRYGSSAQVGSTSDDGSLFRSFPDFESAWLYCLRATRWQPEFENSPRGFRSRENIGVSYRIQDARERAVRSRSRRSNLVFNFAEVLWYLRGSCALDEIAFYAPRIARYSSDGRTLCGTAYGPRIFRSGSAALDQWQQVVDTLGTDSDSKRAVLQIFAPEELLDRSNVDVACTLSLQYLIREGALHSVAYMRANDAYVGSVSDVFSFTFMQELMATELCVDVGSYTHFAGSYHLYLVDEDRADSVLATPDDRVSEARFPAMPRGDNWPLLWEVQSIEHRIRTSGLAPSQFDIDGMGLGEYWSAVVTLFALFGRFKTKGTIDAELVDSLPPLFAAMFKNCFVQK